MRLSYHALDFDRRLMRESRGSVITLRARVYALASKLDDALSLRAMVDEMLADTHTGRNEPNGRPGVVIDVPVSVGELIDKITILEIKLARFADAAKRTNVAAELAVLQTIATRHGLDRDERVTELGSALKQVNETLWVIEERIRRCEDAGDFSPTFIELARSVYRTNDERARIKRTINVLSNSAWFEEKSY
jgi:hypothetical protein